MEYRTSTSTVVVGGGIMGATTLWELARRGAPAMLFEARAFGHESTGKSAAIVRMHYSNPAVVRMALRGRQAFAELPELLGCAPVYRRAGWLFLVDEEGADVARRNREMQLAEGSASVELDLAELERLVPGIRLEEIAYALFEEDSGFADPIAATKAYADAAKREGAYAFEQTPVERIETANGRVTGVIVKGQRIACERVVLAAGAWSKKLAADVGVDLPMEITREQDVIYETGVTAAVPVAISDQADRIYLRPLVEEGPSLLLVGRGFPKQYELVDPDDYDHDVDETFDDDVRTRAVGRIPRLDGMRMVDSRVGLYSVPPDWHPLLGPVDGVEGLVLATGGSGHCFKLGPAIGEMVAGAIVGEPVDYADISLFNLDRFAKGTMFVSTFGGNRG